MYAVGSRLPFPGWCCYCCCYCKKKNKYNDSTLLMSLSNSNEVKFFLDFAKALEFARSNMWMDHSSLRTSLPLSMRAIFEVSGEKDKLGIIRIKKIEKACLPDPRKLQRWRDLNFDTSKSIYENNYTIEGFVYTIFFSDRINLITRDIED